MGIKCGTVLHLAGLYPIRRRPKSIPGSGTPPNRLNLDESKLRFFFGRVEITFPGTASDTRSFDALKNASGNNIVYLLAYYG